MTTAMYYQTLNNDSVQCNLCPHQCIIKIGRTGICNTRRNSEGRLESINYGILSATSLDPIEKKPLYHYFPGRDILSIGSFGCNLKCSFCQNCNISQVGENGYSKHRSYHPEDVINMAKKTPSNIGIAYTYNEPTVFFEFMIGCAEMAHQLDMKNVVISNGFINQAPLDQLIVLTDAFNIDLKSFSKAFYRKITGSAIEPVLKTIQRIAKSGKHLELTFLVIPELNDDEKEFREMVKWIYDHCGEGIVLHLSRYYPNHELSIPPTPIETIADFVNIAEEKLPYVYPGNVGNQLSADTRCPNCDKILISRNYYETTILFPDNSGVCPECKNVIFGQF